MSAAMAHEGDEAKPRPGALMPHFRPSAYDEQALNRFRFQARLLWRLSPRESQMAYLLCCGHTTAAIIARLTGISEQTVRNHKSALFKKLGTGDMTASVMRVWREFLRAHQTAQKVIDRIDAAVGKEQGEEAERRRLAALAEAEHRRADDD